MKQLQFLSLKALAKLFCMVALLSATSCARTADDIDISKEISQERKMEPDASIEGRTVQLFSSLYANTLRNGEEPILSSLDSTDTDSPDTKLYLANFTNGGFMLFRDGGGEEMDVIGHSDKSSLHFSDAEENPILAQIFRTSSSNQGFVGDLGVSDPDLPPKDPILREFPKYQIEHQSSPYIEWIFVPKTYQYFGQEYPFNSYIHKWSITSENIAAGCGPIAIVTLLSHYEMQAGGSNVDWKKLKAKYNDDRAEDSGLTEDTELLNELRFLVKDAWSYAHFWSMGYFTMSTAANVSGYLRRAGFSVRYEKDYKAFEVCNILRAKHQPFILRGWSKDEDGKKAHYWVVDGFAQRVHKESGHVIESLGATPKPYETEVIDATYIHCTWGWNGSKNGWFYPIVINDKQGKKDYELRSSHPKGEYYDISTFYISK